MTLVFKKAFPGHRTRSLEDEIVVATDNTQRILNYQKMHGKTKARFPLVSRFKYFNKISCLLNLSSFPLLFPIPLCPFQLRFDRSICRGMFNCFACSFVYIVVEYNHSVKPCFYISLGFISEMELSRFHLLIIFWDNALVCTQYLLLLG